MYQSCCGLRTEFKWGCCRCLSSLIRDEVGLKRDFCLQHHIPHLLTHKSPCSAHLGVPLAVCFFLSVNLFVICLSNENGTQKCLDGVELWRDAHSNFQQASLCLPSLYLISRDS